MSRGVFLSLLASILFAVMAWFTTLLQPLSGQEIFGWRMLLTFPFVSLLVLRGSLWPLARDLAVRVRQRPALAALLVLSAFLLGMQLWLFLWAPVHGKALDLSLGYFLLPLSMVVVGRVFYGERLSAMQKLAVSCAIVGVGYQLWQTGGFSWVSLLVALGYPGYLMLRRHLGTAHIGGLWWDMALMLPVALWYAVLAAQPAARVAEHAALWGLIPLLGLISAAALVCYFAASRLLSFSLFGLLGYVEPILLVGVALMLDERIANNEWPTYFMIWLAVLCLAIEGLRSTIPAVGKHP